MHPVPLYSENFPLQSTSQSVRRKDCSLLLHTLNRCQTYPGKSAVSPRCPVSDMLLQTTEALQPPTAALHSGLSRPEASVHQNRETDNPPLSPCSAIQLYFSVPLSDRCHFLPNGVLHTNRRPSDSGRQDTTPLCLLRRRSDSVFPPSASQSDQCLKGIEISSQADAA